MSIVHWIPSAVSHLVGARLELRDCRIQSFPDKFHSIQVVGWRGDELRSYDFDELDMKAAHAKGELVEFIVSRWRQEYPDAVPTTTAGDVVEAVKSGKRITSRQMAAVVLVAFERKLITADEVLDAIELMVTGACADLRAYHRIPEVKP